MPKMEKIIATTDDGTRIAFFAATGQSAKLVADLSKNVSIDPPDGEARKIIPVPRGPKKVSAATGNGTIKLATDKPPNVIDGHTPPAPILIPSKNNVGEVVNLIKGAAKFAAATAKEALGIVVSDEIYFRRMYLCATCDAKNAQGELFYRKSTGGGRSCGAPRLTDLLRNEKKEGCGCSLEKKAKIESEHCPLEIPRW